MKKGDVVFLIGTNDRIIITVIESIKDTTIDGKKQPREFLVSKYFAGEPEWYKEEELYVTIKDAIGKMRKDMVEGIEEKLSIIEVYDSRYKNGIKEKLDD